MNNIYKVLKNRILKSKSYSNYAVGITDDIYKYFLELGINESNNYELAFKNIDFMDSFSRNILHNEKEFNKVLFSSFDEEVDVIRQIVSKKFLETYIGNENKEDLDEIDAFFPLLESIFGLDTLLLSIKDSSVLISKFRNVFNMDIANFYEAFSKIYKEAKGKNYDEIISIIRNNSSELKDYVTTGILFEISDVSNNDKKNFEKANELLARSIEILGDKAKIM